MQEDLLVTLADGSYQLDSPASIDGSETSPADGSDSVVLRLQQALPGECVEQQMCLDTQHTLLGECVEHELPSLDSTQISIKKRSKSCREKQHGTTQITQGETAWQTL